MLALREKELLMSVGITEVTHEELQVLLNWKSIVNYQDCLYKIMSRNYKKSLEEEIQVFFACTNCKNKYDYVFETNRYHVGTSAIFTAKCPQCQTINEKNMGVRKWQKIKQV